MNYQNRESYRKRKREVEYRTWEQNTPANPESLEEAIAMGKSKITDLNDDCLDQIFKKLQLKDLLNVSDSNKRFKKPVGYAFASNYGDHEMDMRCFCHQNLKQLKINGNFSLQISGMLYCLKILRCFGHKISKLTICYGSINEDQEANVNQYLNEYCADSLVSIRIEGATIPNLIKPFCKIETIEFRFTHLDFKITKFNKWFPNMRRLRFEFVIDTKMEDRRCIEKHFPHLEEIEFYGFSMEINFNETNIANALRLNPQLRKVMLPDCTVKFVQDVCQYLQSVEILSIWCHDLSIHGHSIIHFKSVKKFEIFLFGNVRKIPFSFDQLQELKINGYEPAEPVISFIVKNTLLTKLTIDKWFYPNLSEWEEDTVKLVRASPLLTEIEIIHPFLKLHDVFYIIESWKILRKIRFKYKSSKYQDLKNRLNDGWRCSLDKIDSDFVILERSIE